MKVILIGTGDIAVRVVEKLVGDNRIDFLGVIQDEAVNETAREYYAAKYKEIGSEVLEFTDENMAKADLIFACEYRRVIERAFVEKYTILNCHAGILPKYRGFSANAWAIMNGENTIGYTIHKMDYMLDNGDIYYTGRFSILHNQTYADLYDEIFDDMVNRISDILVYVYTGVYKAQKQSGYGVYCSKFYAALGDLKDFNNTSEYIYNLYRCMAKPHGSGVYFWHKEKKYYIGKMQMGADIGIENYIGISGKVVNFMDDAIWVKTVDNLVILDEITTDDGTKIKEGHFKIGNKFGM